MIPMFFLRGKKEKFKGTKLFRACNSTAIFVLLVSEVCEVVASTDGGDLLSSEYYNNELLSLSLSISSNA